MAVNKVIYGGNTVIDLTNDTLSNPNQLSKGVVAHTKDGNVIIGTLDAEVSGGDYNITYSDNGDGTQNIFITDAEGGSSGNANIDETVVTFDTTNDTLKTYVENAYDLYSSNDTTTIVENYVDKNADYDQPTKYTINGLTSGNIYLLDETTGKCKKDVVTGSSYDVYNLIPKHTYRCINMDNTGIKNIIRIKDTSIIRMLKLDKTFNVRDLGGRNCDGGTVNYGLIYRGARFISSSGSVYLSEKDKDTFRNYLGVSNEIDMRKEDEIYEPANYTSPIGANVIYDRLTMKQGYTGGFGIASSERPQAKKIIEQIMNNAINDVVTYFHCASGADRTGTVASILNGVLGVSQLDLDIDYEVTSLSHHDEIYRPRYATEGYGKYWKEWKDYIHAFDGDNPYVTYCQQLGISNDLLNAFRRKMIDGTPSEITGGGSTEEPEVPSSENLLLSAIDIDGSLYNNGFGYKEGYRINSSGIEVSSTSTGVACTGFIPASVGDRFEVENLLIPSSTSYPNYSSSTMRITAYDLSKEQIIGKGSGDISTYNNDVIIENDRVKLFTLNSLSDTTSISKMAYIRITFIKDNLEPVIRKEVEKWQLIQNYKLKK